MYSQAFANGWHKHIAPAQVCRGSQNYYWALFKLAPGELAEPSSSLADFLREREPALYKATCPGPRLGARLSFGHGRSSRAPATATAASARTSRTRPTRYSPAETAEA